MSENASNASCPPAEFFNSFPLLLGLNDRVHAVKYKIQIDWQNLR